MEENLNSCLILFEYTGLQYFSLKPLTKDGKRPSVLRTAYMLVLLVGVNALAVFYILFDYSMVRGELTSRNIVMYAIKSLMIVGLVTVLSVSFVQSFVSTQSVKKIYLNSKETVQLCLEFKLNIDFKKIKRNALKKVCAMLSFIFALHGFVMLSHMNNLHNTLQLTLGIFPMLFLLVVVYKFVFYVDIVNSQLRLLETILEEIFRYQPSKINDNDVDLKQVEPSKPVDDVTFSKLRVLWKMYNLIYDNGTLINESIGLTVLTLLIGCAIALTVSGYEIFVTIVGGRSIQNLPGKFLSNSRLFLFKSRVVSRNSLHHVCCWSNAVVSCALL